MNYQLAYRSEASEITREDIGDIVASSEKNNAAQGITGCLVFGNDFFIQMLEGHVDSVKQLLETIEDDVRNTNLTILHEGACTEKVFPDWEMGYLNLEAEDVSCESEIEEGTGDGTKASPTFLIFMYNIEQLSTRNGHYATSGQARAKT